MIVQEESIDALTAAICCTATRFAVRYTLAVYYCAALRVDEGVGFVGLCALFLVALEAVLSEECLAGSAADLCACNDSMCRVIFSCEEVSRLASVAFIGAGAADALLAKVKRAALADVLILHEPVVEATLFRESSKAAKNRACSEKNRAEAETTHELLTGERLLRLDIDLRVVTLDLSAVEVDNLDQREQQKGSKEDPLNCLQVLIV